MQAAENNKCADLRCGNQPFCQHESGQHLSDNNHNKMHEGNKGIGKIGLDQLLCQNEKQEYPGTFQSSFVLAPNQ